MWRVIDSIRGGRPRSYAGRAARLPGSSAYTWHFIDSIRGGRPKLPVDIPGDIETFYSQFQPLVDPKTGREITELSPESIRIWEDERRSYSIYLKPSDKHESNVFKYIILHAALTESTRYGGGVLLIGAKSKEAAKDIIRQLLALLDSSRYRDYVIRKHTPYDNLGPSDKTKSDMIYLRCAADPAQPNRIMALSATNPTNFLSIKGVFFVYASDITTTRVNPWKMGISLGYMHGRLINSRGPMLVQTAPGPAVGSIWRICNQAGAIKTDGRTIAEFSDPESYLVRKIRCGRGIDVGVVDLSKDSGPARTTSRNIRFTRPKARHNVPQGVPWQW